MKIFLIGMIIVILLRLIYFMPIKIQGRSMQNTLFNNELVMCYKKSKIKRFDIVVVQRPDKDKAYIKRVIGLPGENIRYQDGQLYINNASYSEPFIEPGNLKYNSGRYKTRDLDCPIPQNNYYVLGDNRGSSVDSRSFGPVDRSEIKAVASFVFWPFNRIRKL